jgi:hypothetical protein
MYKFFGNIIFNQSIKILLSLVIFACNLLKIRLLVSDNILFNLSYIVTFSLFLYILLSLNKLFTINESTINNLFIPYKQFV